LHKISHFCSIDCTKFNIFVQLIAQKLPNCPFFSYFP